MNTAVCTSCGEYRAGTFIACPQCGHVPDSRPGFARSLAYSNHLLTTEQLAQLSQKVRCGYRDPLPPGALAQAQEALEDRQLQDMLTTWPPQPAASGASQEAWRLLPARQLTETALHRTPFAVLGASVHDDRRRIVELAEAKSLELDSDLCQKALADLTNPRTRLGAEMAWLPGFPPDKAPKLLAGLVDGSVDTSGIWGAPVLADLNVAAATLEFMDEHYMQYMPGTIVILGSRESELTPEGLRRLINEDRALSGFPPISALDQIEFEIDERKRYYRSAVKDALNRLPPAILVDMMTEVADAATAGSFGQTQLVDDIVDSYEMHAQEVLGKEADNVAQLIAATRDSVGAGEAAIAFYLDQIESVARNWNLIARPVRLNRHGRGLHYPPANDLAWALRSLSLDLFNQHGMLESAQRLTALVRGLFSDIPEVAERVDEDSTALADIAVERKQAADRQSAWEREISYSAKIGLFRDELHISPEGLSWKGRSFPLDAVTRVRWGGVRRSLNGVPTGTSFTIAFGDNRHEAVVQLTNEDTYTAFIGKLWPAVCVRLLGEMLQALKAGDTVLFGDAALHDDGMTLTKRRLFGREKVRLTWQELHVWNASGMFFIGAQEDKKTFAGISYIGWVNTHILEHAIRAAFKKTGMNRLSDLLQ